VPPGSQFTSISAITETSPSEVWVTVIVATLAGAHQAALLGMDGNAWQQADIPDPASGPYSLASDGAGGLWIATNAGGDLLHYYDGCWTSKPAPAERGYSTKVEA
jgi:ligand-binding sensor domain-containing protein